MEIRNQYHFYKKELSKLLKKFKVISFHDDKIILDRIINLLTEGKKIIKIKGIISTTEMIKYGGDEVEVIYDHKIEWFDKK